MKKSLSLLILFIILFSSLSAIAETPAETLSATQEETIYKWTSVLLNIPQEKLKQLPFTVRQRTEIQREFLTPDWRDTYFTLDTGEKFNVIIIGEGECIRFIPNTVTLQTLSSEFSAVQSLNQLLSLHFPAIDPYTDDYVNARPLSALTFYDVLFDDGNFTTLVRVYPSNSPHIFSGHMLRIKYCENKEDNTCFIDMIDILPL